jgi:hypothetical protein
VKPSPPGVATNEVPEAQPGREYHAPIQDYNRSKHAKSDVRWAASGGPATGRPKVEGPEAHPTGPDPVRTGG